MRRLIVLVMLILICVPMLVSAQVRVQGYTRQDGTYVQPHYRSSPDSTPTNNYSYPGNTNPYTGKTAPGTPPVFTPAPPAPLYGTPRSR